MWREHLFSQRYERSNLRSHGGKISIPQVQPLPSRLAGLHRTSQFILATHLLLLISPLSEIASLYFDL